MERLKLMGLNENEMDGSFLFIVRIGFHVETLPCCASKNRATPVNRDAEENFPHLIFSGLTTFFTARLIIPSFEIVVIYVAKVKNLHG